MNENQVVNIEEITKGYVKDQYAMYLRKSRADLELEAMGEEETLARHKKILTNLAAKHNISQDQITIYHEMVSGDSIQERPEMQRLISDVYTRKYKGVLVVEVERLARGNTKDQGEVAEAFQYSNTHIITPVKTYDPNNEYDQEYFEFGLFMSRREYKTIKRRMEAGKQSSIEEGNYVLPQRTFGYNILRKTKKDRILVPNETEVPIVQMIFDWYTEEDRSTQWIAQKLTAMGVPTVYKKSEWSKPTVRDMLTNPCYIGKITWNQQKTVKKLDEETGKLVKKRENTGDIKVYEGKHDGIISVEQFNKAQEITKNRSRPRTKENVELKNPLAGIMKCCDCGAMIEYIDYASCPSHKWNTAPRFHHQRKIKCKKKSIAVPVVLDALVEALKAYIEDYQLKIEQNDDQSALIRHQEIIKAMEAELEKQKARKRRVMESWEADDGTYTRDEFIERKNMYTATIEQLTAKIAEEKKSAPVPVDYEEKIINLHALIDCIKDDSMSAKEKNRFLSQYIDNITFDVIDLGRKKGGKPILEVFLK